MIPVPRLPLLPFDTARAAASTHGMPDGLADLNVFRVLLHHPRLAGWTASMLMGLLGEGRLDARLRELVIMRLGWTTGSDYEWTQHWRIAGAFGVPHEDLLGVRDWHAYEGFGPPERAVLAATDETVEHGAITPYTWQACTQHVADDPQILLELVAVIGLWRMVSSMLRSLDVPLEDEMSSWPPDGRGPEVSA